MNTKKKQLIKLDNQYGSAIFYNPFIPQNQLVKMKYDPIQDKINYKSIDTPSNLFTDAQKRDIDALVNFILPFIITPQTGQILGPNVIKEIEFLGAGTFGVTLFYKNLLVKILKIDDSTLKTVINELNISGLLFRDPSGQQYPDIPNSINLIYGFLTSNENVWNWVTNKPAISNEYVELKLYTNLEIIDLKKLREAIPELRSVVKYPMQGHIAALFLHKADLSLTEFIEGFKQMDLDNKTKILWKFYRDMFNALYYIHFNRGYIHNDIKPDNIVIEMGPGLFQLIDFGLLTKLDRVNQVKDREAGTPFFYHGTIYEKKTNILYDWHCILLSAMMMLGLDITQPLYDQFPSPKSGVKFRQHLGNHFEMLVKGKPLSLELHESISRLINMMVNNFYLQSTTQSMIDGKPVNIKKIIEEFRKMIFWEPSL